MLSSFSLEEKKEKRLFQKISLYYRLISALQLQMTQDGKGQFQKSSEMLLLQWKQEIDDLYSQVKNKALSQCSFDSSPALFSGDSLTGLDDKNLFELLKPEMRLVESSY